ncbi:hypothetical protein H7J86_13155 [Mycobacterium hackensackense]|nr:hypothetical protein [Mycobacterium hackensackense]MCV7253114.1 hypothetical protein [Mycobacterium hackensackense]
MQDRDPAGGVDRIVHRAQHLAVGVRRRDVGEVLGHGLAGDREAVTVQQPGIQQCLHHDGDTADLVDILHHVAAEGLDVGQVRNLLSDAGEVRERQLDLRLPRDGQQMQHGVCGTAERHHDGDGVLEGLFGQDVAGGDPAAQQLHDGLTGPARVLVAALVDGHRRSAAGQGHTERLGGRGHGVGGVHAATGTLARADRPFDDVHIRTRHQPPRARPDRLEGVDDGDFLLRAVGQLGDARHDRAVVQEHRGEIEPGGGHQHAGNRLVAAGQQHGPVEALGLHDGLDAVGDHLTGHQ